jgi:hypothetical protein
MVRMTKRNWLLTSFALPRRIRRIGNQLEKRSTRPTKDEHCKDETGSR